MLQALRADRGLTITDVAEGSGVSFKTISRYERGVEPRPRLATLEKLAAFYRVRASMLLEDLKAFQREQEQRISDEMNGVAGLELPDAA